MLEVVAEMAIHLNAAVAYGSIEVPSLEDFLTSLHWIYLLRTIVNNIPRWHFSASVVASIAQNYNYIQQCSLSLDLLN